MCPILLCKFDLYRTFCCGFAAGESAAKALPAFAHEALLVGREGKLSKRLGSLGCDAFRGLGIEPEAIIALLARLGTSQTVEPIAERATGCKL